MAHEILIPGPEAPATPGFVCSIPEGWSAAEAPGAVVSFTPSDVADVSVLVTATRVAKEVDLRDVAVRSFAQQRQVNSEVTIDSQRVGRFGERVVYVRGVTVPGDRPVAQVHGLFFGPAGDDRSTADVFSVVGSCPASVIADFGPAFVDILASISFAEQP